MDRYDEVAIKILGVINKYGKNGPDKGDENLQKNITDILKDNFNIADEEMGRGLMKDTRIFDPDNGREFDVPLFTVPVLLPFGAKIIRDDVFPNYDVDNKYIGYMEKGVFYKINDFTLFMRRARKNPIPIIMIFILVYIIIAILALSIKT